MILCQTGYEPRYMPVIRERYGTNRVTTEMWAEICATYYGMISRLDDQFGRILSLVEGKVLWEKTISLFFTDHGEYLGGYGLIEKWPSGLSDSLVKEPLIIGGAGLPSGKINDAMSEMVDLIPTLFQLCGIGEHFPHNGKSLVPTILHGVEHKEFAFSEGGFLKSEEPLLEQAPYPYDIKAALQHEDTSLVGKRFRSGIRDGHISIACMSQPNYILELTILGNFTIWWLTLHILILRGQWNLPCSSG